MLHYLLNDIRETVVEIVGFSYLAVTTSADERERHVQVVQNARDNAIPIVQQILDKTNWRFNNLKRLHGHTTIYDLAYEEIALACIKLLSYHTESAEILMRAPENRLTLKMFIAQKILLALEYLEGINDYKMSPSTRELHSALVEKLCVLEKRLIKQKALIGILFHEHHLIGLNEIKNR